MATWLETVEGARGVLCDSHSTFDPDGFASDGRSWGPDSWWPDACTKCKVDNTTGVVLSKPHQPWRFGGGGLVNTSRTTYGCVSGRHSACSGVVHFDTATAADKRGQCQCPCHKRGAS